MRRRRCGSWLPQLPFASSPPCAEVNGHLTGSPDFGPRGSVTVWISTRLVRKTSGSSCDGALMGLLMSRVHACRRGAAAGNPLLVRELVNAGLQSGAIAFRRGVWQLADDMVLGSSLTDLIRSTVTHLRAEETQAVQLVALAEPLRLSLAQRLIETEVLERLEDSQVIALRDGEEGPALSCAHPLYREVVLADLAGAIPAPARPPDRRDRGRRSAIGPRTVAGGALAAWTGPGRPRRSAAGGSPIARAASPRSAEELALAAASAGAGIEATLLLAEVLLLQGASPKLMTSSTRSVTRHSATNSSGASP